MLGDVLGGVVEELLGVGVGRHPSRERRRRQRRGAPDRAVRQVSREPQAGTGRGREGQPGSGGEGKETAAARSACTLPASGRAPPPYAGQAWLRGSAPWRPFSGLQPRPLGGAKVRQGWSDSCSLRCRRFARNRIAKGCKSKELRCACVCVGCKLRRCPCLYSGPRPVACALAAPVGICFFLGGGGDMVEPEVVCGFPRHPTLGGSLAGEMLRGWEDAVAPAAAAPIGGLPE